MVHDVHNGESEDISSVDDPATTSPPDDSASTQLHHPEAATVHRDQPTDTDKKAAGQPLGRGFWEKVPSVLLRDYVTPLVFAKNPSPSTPSSNTSSGRLYPLAHYINQLL